MLFHWIHFHKSQISLRYTRPRSGKKEILKGPRNGGTKPGVQNWLVNKFTFWIFFHQINVLYIFFSTHLSSSITSYNSLLTSFLVNIFSFPSSSMYIHFSLSLSQSSTIFHFSIFYNSINPSQEFLKIQSEGPKSSVRIHWTSGWVQDSRSPICSSPSVDTVPVYIISSPAIIARYFDFIRQYSSNFLLTASHGTSKWLPHRYPFGSPDLATDFLIFPTSHSHCDLLNLQICSSYNAISASNPDQYSGLSVTMDYIPRGPTPLGSWIKWWSRIEGEGEGENKKYLEWGWEKRYISSSRRILKHCETFPSFRVSKREDWDKLKSVLCDSAEIQRYIICPAHNLC